MSPASDAPVPAAAEQQPARPRGCLWLVLSLVLAMVWLATLCALGARHSALCDLFTHFRAYYAGAFLVLAMLFVWRRQWIASSLCIAGLAYNASFIAPLYFDDAPPAAQTVKLRCLLANVHTANTQYERFVEYVRAENPDVLVAIETDDEWVRALESLKKDYPHTWAEPRSDNFGIAFYSRLPVESAEFRDFGGVGLPSIVAKVKVEQATVTIVGTHPVPPMWPQLAQKRNAHLAALASAVRDMGPNVIVLGDLNTTSWSPYFQDFVDVSGLRDSRKGFGIQPTWNRRRLLVRIPIDHALASPGIAVVNRRVGDDIGSDHLPVVVDFGIDDAK